MKPVNPEEDPIVFTGDDGEQSQVVAELVEVQERETRLSVETSVYL